MNWCRRTILGNDKLDDGHLIDDRAWLTARAEQCWISIDTWVHGSAKSEQVMLLTNKYLNCQPRRSRA